jgi:hypothetical protein
LLQLQGISSLGHVSKHGREDHDRESDPKQNEEASEIMVVAVWVEVGNAVHVFDTREHALFLLGANLATR